MAEDIARQIAASPFEGSTFAPAVDKLFYTMTLVCCITAVSVIFLVIIFCWRYRQNRQVNREIRLANAHWLEYLWIAIPLCIFLVFFTWGANLYIRFQNPPPNPLVIQGIAKQWMWKFYHSDGQREINELHIPRGQPVLLRIVSEDVIHSFYVPAFRVKRDIVPGRSNELSFTASEVGVYHLFCAEFCGSKHSKMRGVVTVMEPQKYSYWLNSRPANQTLTQAGKKLFLSSGCSGCHTQGSSVSAPILEGVAGQVVNLQNGIQVKADNAYLRDSILLPEKQVVAGYDSIMPSYSGQLSEDEVLKLVSYLQALGVDRNQAVKGEISQ